jgi:hypothetical protein
VTRFVDYSNLPKRYALSVEVKLIELPDQFKEPEKPFEFSTDNPMQQAAELMGHMGRVATAVPHYPMYPQQPSGFDFRKSAQVTVQSFGGLAHIVEQFEELTRKIEAEQP